jgi:acyl-CoA dehydrogenase
MDFSDSDRVSALKAELQDFMNTHVYPAEPVYAAQRSSALEQGDPHALPPIVDELKAEARRRGLWNLFLPDQRFGAGLTNVEYAPLAEVMGRSVELAPEATNCAAPDTGNMELLAQFGTPEQQERWLLPLLEGRIRSCFGMTEPDVASSDATNIATRIVADGDDYVITGRKWWTTGVLDRRCEIMIVMGVSDPDGPPHGRHSMVLVPLDTPGVTVLRNLTVFGNVDQHGHGEVVLDGVRVPKSYVLGTEGSGFALSQARLGPGRIHHCMCVIGMSERALELMVERALSRTAFGGPLSDQGVIADWVGQSRIELEQVRLLCLKTAWLMDTAGNKSARTEISAIKVAATQMAMKVLDRAIQVFGAAGVSQDTPLASWWAHARTLRLADGPDEVHVRSLARREFRLGEERLKARQQAGDDAGVARVGAATAGV